MKPWWEKYWKSNIVKGAYSRFKQRNKQTLKSVILYMTVSSLPLHILHSIIPNTWRTATISRLTQHQRTFPCNVYIWNPLAICTYGILLMQCVHLESSYWCNMYIWNPLAICTCGILLLITIFFSCIGLVICQSRITLQYLRNLFVLFPIFQCVTTFVSWKTIATVLFSVSQGLLSG
jgi:hypothetical protein